MEPTKEDIEYLFDDPEAEKALKEVQDYNEEKIDDLPDTSLHESNRLQSIFVPQLDMNDDILAKERDEEESNELENVQEKRTTKILKKKERIIIEEYCCCICREQHSTAESLSDHMETIHATICNVNQEKNKGVKVFRYSCPWCYLKFRKKSSIKIHITDKTFVEMPEKKSDRSADKQPVACSACGKMYTNRYEVKHHFNRMHVEDKHLKCSGCDKTFACEKILRRHEQRHGPKRFVCEHCSRAFAMMSQLKSHLNTHLVIKPYQCHICNKTYSHKAPLETHIMQHTDPKPFKCTICPKMYKWPEDLNMHQKAEHEGNYRYKCRYCTKGYTASSNKKYHEKRCPSNPNAITKGMIDVPDFS